MSQGLRQAVRTTAGGAGGPFPFVIGAVLGGVLVWIGLALSWGPADARPARPDPVRTPAEAYDWRAAPEPTFPLPPYARHLAGVRIVLDPGHIGQRDPGGTWKRGPTGLREAEVNLRVAHFLREFLESVGADVRLTRSEDISLDLPDHDDLAQRAAVANDCRADLLLSIHHNGSSNPDANYTSVFYHDAPGHPRASLCAARFLLNGLHDALRLESHLECALHSDRVLYENGLAVLRAARVPAVLTEASFHSHPAEEERLRDPLYNRREAYGLFLGLARWAQAGLPRVALAAPADARVRPGQDVVISLDDGLSGRGGWGAEMVKILPESLVVRLDGRDVAARAELQKRRVRVTLPKRLRGERCMLWVDFTNTFGQQVLHPGIPLRIARR